METKHTIFFAVIVLWAVAGFAPPASAQLAPNNAQVVSACGTTSSTYSTNDVRPLAQDTSGRACGATTAAGSGSATNSLTSVTPSSALESSHVMCSAACNAYGFQANTTTAAEWVMAFNATSAPGNGAVTPARWWQIPANGTIVMDMTEGGVPIRYTIGWTLVCSTTGPFTKTASALCTFAGEKQ